MELVEGQKVTVRMGGREMTTTVVYRKPWETVETLKSADPYWREAGVADVL